MYIPEVLFIFTFYICSCYGGEEEKRLILHSGDDIAQEFQKLRQELQSLQMNHTREIQLLMTNYTQEVESLKKNYTQTTESLKRKHTQEIQALMSTQTAEIDSVKATQKREIQALNDTQSQKIKSLKNELTTLKQDQGSTYIRWGKTTCGGNGTHIIYTGFTSGSPYDKEGGAAKYICLPKTPTWAKYVDGIQNIGGYMTGTEFDIYPNVFNPFPRNMQDQDAPCVLCRSPRPTTVMVPGRTNCYPGWTMEYTGYLMTDHVNHNSASDYACVDVNPEAVYHGEANQNGKLFYFTEVKCGSLPCQEYPNGRELACVVCSK